MKTASVTETKNDLSGLLRHVKAGKSVLILDRNIPVARLEPVAPYQLPDEQRLLSLERRGLIRRPKKSGSIVELLAKLPFPKLPAGTSAVAALLADREDDNR